MPVGDGTPPAVAAAAAGAAPAGPVDPGAAARAERAARVQELKDREAALKVEQSNIKKRLKQEARTHAKAAKKLRALPNATIIQVLRERGVAVPPEQ